MNGSLFNRFIAIVLLAGVVGMVRAGGQKVEVNPVYANLIAKAKQAMNNSYSPYSNFKVGCALLMQSGKIFTGCNVENASYGATFCAERVAMSKAVSEGSKDIIAMAVVSSGGDFTYPCGLCRQFVAEFGLSNVDVVVTNDKEVKVLKLSDLLINAFTPQALEDAKLVKAVDMR